MEPLHVCTGQCGSHKPRGSRELEWPHGAAAGPGLSALLQTGGGLAADRQMASPRVSWSWPHPGPH